MKPMKQKSESKLCFLAILLVTTTLACPARADFNPNAGADAPSSQRDLESLGSPNFIAPAPLIALPDTTAPAAKTVAAKPAVVKPVAVVAPVVPVKPVAVVAAKPVVVAPVPAPAPKVETVASVATTGDGVSPLPPARVVMPVQTIPKPSRDEDVTPPPVPLEALVEAPPPAPVVAAAPVVKPVQVATAKPVSAVPDVLSHDSKKILSGVPSHLGAAATEPTTHTELSRINPAVGKLEAKPTVDAYESAGISISVRRPGLDTNYELNRAYTALSGGDSITAMQVYKNILSTEPTNADALFGLASLYQRQGQLDKARPLYGVLLKNYPNHRDGLDNFLALISDESPQEALAELQRLEERNPDFSPIPAQQALLLNKLGYGEEARTKMLHAIELSPDNLTYKYNLAIMLDSQGDFAQASDLYRLLINASDKGEVLPASADKLQKRLNYISTAMVESQAKG